MKRFCTKCGREMAEGSTFCTECGTKVPLNTSISQEQMAATQNRAAASYNTYGVETVQNRENSVSTGYFFGMMFVYAIPVIGWIVCLISAFASKSATKKNFAKAMLIWLVIGLVISLLFGFAVKSIVNTVLEQVEPYIEQEGNSSYQEGNFLNGGEDLSALSELGELDAVLGLLEEIGSVATTNSNEENSNNKTNSDTTNSNIEELEALGNMLEELEGLTGEENSSINDFIEGAVQANKDAEAANHGWPDSLRAYPGGTATAEASYRTKISDTTLEEMMGWIEELKKDGFVYQDFYEFGMSEQDMLDMNGWWAYDGKTYLSVSYYEGTVTVDHTVELPDLEAYFGQ